jgi:hypothetical protein
VATTNFSIGLSGDISGDFMNGQSVTVCSKIKCISYGLGPKLDLAFFNQVKNKPLVNKPKGGLWASPVGCKYGWIEAAKEMAIGDFETSFAFTITGEILVIDSFEDLEKFIWTTEELGPFVEFSNPDFEAMKKAGISAIHLTEKGQHETRLTHPRNLYGWDCESILILDEKCIDV